MDQRNPDVVSIDVGRALFVGEDEKEIGSVKLDFKTRIRFLLAGEVTIYHTDSGGSRFVLHAPRYRNLPLRILDWIQKGKE